MKRPALRRASKSTLIFVIAALLFVAGMAGATFGYFDGQTDNVATWSGAFVYAPVSVATTGAIVGGGQTVQWATPTTNGVQNYIIRGTNMGLTTTACPVVTVPVAVTSTSVTPTLATTTTPTTTATYVTTAVGLVTSTIGTATFPGTLTTTPASTVTVFGTTIATPAATITVPVTYPETLATGPAPAASGVATIPTSDSGAFMCYQVANYWSTTAASKTVRWYSPSVNANAGAARAGLWPTAVTENNNNGTLASGDSIVITYNQNVSASGTIKVCTSAANGTITFGNSSGCTGAIVGQLSGITVGTTLSTLTGTISVATNKVTITIGGTGTSTVNVPGTWTGGSGVVQTSASPQVGGCNGCTVTPANRKF